MTDLNESYPVEIRKLEASVAAKLETDLREYEIMSALTFNAMSEINRRASAWDDLSFSGKLGMILLARLQADLRVVTWAAATGYAVPAMTVAASLHENAYILMYIGNSDERAKEWVEHTKTKTTYPECGHANVIPAVVKYFDADERVVVHERGVYEGLCQAKHGNPMLQKEYGVALSEDVVEVQQIPYYSPNTVALGRYALFHSIRQGTLPRQIVVHHPLLPERLRRVQI